MPIQKLILICIVFASALLGSVLAADKPFAQADMDKLQEQIRTLDKELAVQREAFVRKLEDVEKRQTEITAQQANSLAAIANQTASVGNHIANTSILITVLVLGAGFITYFSAKGRAEKEAQEAAATWIEKNAARLNAEIEQLKLQVTSAKVQIDGEVTGVTSTAATARQSIDAHVASTILNAPKASAPGAAPTAAEQQAIQVVTQVSAELKTKPESEYIAAEFYARGLSYFSTNDFPAALAAFNEALKPTNKPITPAVTAEYLLAKGVTLSKLDKPQDAIAVYDDLDRRFGADTTSAVRDQVARGLFNKGATLGKLDKPHDAIAVYDDLDKRFGADTTLAVREVVASGLVNKGSTLGQLDKPQDEIAVYDELHKRFGADTAPAVLKQVARGLSNKNFSQILLAKQLWLDDAQRVKLLHTATSGLKQAVLQCSEDDRVTLLGNLGYSLFLTGQNHAAEETTLECLRLGGQIALAAQRADAKLHRVEPEDSQYEELLNKLWQSLPPEATES